MKIYKKGLLGLNQLTGIIMLLVVIGVMLTVGLRINNQIENDSPSVTASDNKSIDAIRNASEGLINVSENQGLLGTIIIFGIIISVVVVAFMVGGKGF